MIVSDSFVKSGKARDVEFTTCQGKERVEEKRRAHLLVELHRERLHAGFGEQNPG